MGSDGSPYEKRVDAKGRVLSEKHIADEVPFEKLPEGWAWARLSSIASFGGGKTPSTSDKSNYAKEGILWVTSKDMKKERIESTQIMLSDKGASELALYASGCIIMVTRSGILRRLLPVAILDKPATVNQDQKVIIPNDYSLSEWLLRYFQGNDQRIRYDFGKDGTTVESIVFDKVKDMLVSIPPLTEQRRIVKRIGELMPLVEQYGKLEDAREALDASLPGCLRKSVLQMAVQGKLVPQDPADEPASELLERIREHRRKLIAEKKMKSPKGGESVIYTGSDGRRYEKRIDAKGLESEPVCIEDEIPFDVPDSWGWIRLGSLVVNRGQKKPESRFTYIDIASIDNENQKLQRGVVLEPANAPSRARRMVHKGDILYSTVRPYLHNACIIDTNFENELIASTGFAAMTCPYGFLSSLLLCYLVSPCFDEYVNASENSKGVAYPAINDSRLYKALVPVPPLKEQERIVGQLLALKQ